MSDEIIDDDGILASAVSLWGKSGQDRGRTVGQPNRLLQHLYDTLAVGEILWDQYFPEGLKERLDDSANGRGRALFSYLCGVHDVGKATPKFQSKVDDLARRVRVTGLSWDAAAVQVRSSRWHHTLAGAAIIRAADHSPNAADSWIWPLIAGHHGRVPDYASVVPDKKFPEDHGRDARWGSVQQRLLQTVAEACGFADPPSAPEFAAPSPGDQLTILGYIIMADWIASNADAMPGIDEPLDVSLPHARVRAGEAWKRLDLRSGWTAKDGASPDPIAHHWGRCGRPVQLAAIQLARDIPTPGLMIIEAPTGIGKTEAGLACAEVLAARFGARGVFVGMPTQATADPMFTRLNSWREQVAGSAPVVLLHGKRQFNPQWRQLADDVAPLDVYDEYGEPLSYGERPAEHDGVRVAVDWLIGHKRGLLAPFGVGTVDNLLFAGTRTKHVMVRHAGLASKVVILDEVHAASTYMSQFMAESLRWLGSSGTPVVLLTATLPPWLKQHLVSAYLHGCGQTQPTELAAPTGYPSLLAAASFGDEIWVEQRTADAGDLRTVRVEPIGDEEDRLVDSIRETLDDGGVALVVRNTVRRAQTTFRRLAGEFGDDVELLHARFTVAERARRTKAELNRLGPPDQPDVSRPRRHILVATQVAEQSLDIDVDLLATDIAPIDLLVQRIGRLHRHYRESRPERVARPRVLIAGMELQTDGPAFAPGIDKVYSEHLLLRTTDQILACVDSGGEWVFPTDVPRLVEFVYGDAPVNRVGWHERLASARLAEDGRLDAARKNARQFLLSRQGRPLPSTLAGLHVLDVKVSDADADAMKAVVREGDPSAEIMLVTASEDDDLRTLSGLRLTAGHVMVDDDRAIEEAVGSLVRLPGWDPGLTSAAELLPVPPEWAGHPVLDYLRPLVMTPTAPGRYEGSLDGPGRTWRITYDTKLGLEVAG